MKPVMAMKASTVEVVETEDVPRSTPDSYWLSGFFFPQGNWSILQENLSLGFPTSSYRNLAIQPQKMLRGLKFQIQEVEGLYYLCSKNKVADQLHFYRTADLPLCFRMMPLIY